MFYSFTNKNSCDLSSFLFILPNRHQAGWFPFRQEGGQQQAPNNNAEVNDGQHANNLELEEMVCYRCALSTA